MSSVWILFIAIKISWILLCGLFRVGLGFNQYQSDGNLGHTPEFIHWTQSQTKINHRTAHMGFTAALSYNYLC